MIRFHIDEDLYKQWQPIIQKNWDFHLANICTGAESAKIWFYLEYEKASDNYYYCCKVHYQDSRGNAYESFAQHTDGNIAIRDSILRIRRDAIRRSKHSGFFAATG